MPEAGQRARREPERPEWYPALATYETPNYYHAIRQLCNTFTPLLAVLALMFFLVKHEYPYWITLTLSVLGAGLLIRSFIFLHDCSHGSFFPSPRANAILGFIVGVLTMTPYEEWRWTHLKHHGSFANLDRRGIGDIQLMTVEEYLATPRLQQFVYRMYRHPLVLFGLGSTVLFAVIYRFTIRGTTPRERRSVWLTNGAILAMGALASLFVGLRAFLLVMTPVWCIAWAIGVLLFYLQHQFPGVYWARQDQWDFFRAALEGSSYCRLPTVLQWFTGNIGLHHLHHLRPRIPNYHLQQAYNETPAIHGIQPLSLRGTLRALRMNLYDELRQQLVSFHDLTFE